MDKLMRKSGVYRASSFDAVANAVLGSPLLLTRISLEGVLDKAALLKRIAERLDFPAWFGANWDALEDCLADLSWREAPGHVLVFEDFQSLPADERGVLIDVLAAAAESWASRGKPFYGVFIDPHRKSSLEDLCVVA